MVLMGMKGLILSGVCVHTGGWGGLGLKLCSWKPKASCFLLLSLETKVPA